MIGRCPEFIRTLCPKPQIYLNFIELIQEKQRFAQVSAAANRAAPGPGQALAFVKNEGAIEAARRHHLQPLCSMPQTFLQMSQMTGDFTFAESNRLREVPGRKGVADKRL